jgi:hypothetical protein
MAGKVTQPESRNATHHQSQKNFGDHRNLLLKKHTTATGPNQELVPSAHPRFLLTSSRTGSGVVRNPSITGGTTNLTQTGRGCRKNLGPAPLWWRFKSGLAEKASAALFCSAVPPCQITACQGSGDRTSQTGVHPLNATLN